MVAGVTRTFKGETQGLCPECQKNFVRNGDKCVFCAIAHKENALRKLEESFSSEQRRLFVEYKMAESIVKDMGPLM